MQTNRAFRRIDCRSPYALASTAIAALPTFATPAHSSCTIPSGFTLGVPGSSYGFFTNFASTSSLLSTYAVSLGGGSTTSTPGDLNALYTNIYYSVANNFNSWYSNGYCPFELVLVGTFPDSRYFAVVDNDAHYASTQHIADLAMDPVQYTTTGGTTTYQNQFVVGLGTDDGSLSYEANQYFMVPISLGYVPSGAPTAGCGIPPFEGDNLLDATQRHGSMDWNPTVNPTSPGGYPLLPSVGEINSTSLLSRHIVDSPEHAAPSGTISGDVDGWNTAGSIIIRNYLQPPLSCSGSSGEWSCSATVTGPSYYLLIRDANSGCAYEVTTELQNELFYNNLSAGNNGALAIVSTSNGDPASSSNLPSGDAGYWMDGTQKAYHTLVANTTPQACFADGNTGAGNICAWARGPEYEPQPGPEDAYIGANVNYAKLEEIKSNNEGCTSSCEALLFQFALPNPTPETPCAAPYGCSLSGSEPLRYMSLTFEQEQSSGSVQPLVSIADSAFATTYQSGSGQYLVNLVVNVSGTLPSWLQPPSTPWGDAPVGFSPVLVSPTGSSTYATYPVWQVTAAGTNYTVLDLTTIPNESLNALSSSGVPITVPPLSIGGTPAYDLRIQIRTTLPATSFGCAGQSVPYSTAVYTGGTGTLSYNTLMGPYVPFVSVWTPGGTAAAPPTAKLPTSISCGQMPGTPYLNTPITSTGITEVTFPLQLWPTATSPLTPPYLNCSNNTTVALPTTPQVYFVTTQAPNVVTGSMDCDQPWTATDPNPCDQIILQSAENTSNPAAPWTPGLPLKIVGTGFGYQPSMTLPFAGLGSAAPPNLVIGDCHLSNSCTGTGDLTWYTSTSGVYSACQVYIQNCTDSSISLVLALGTEMQNDYLNAEGLSTYLSPITDVSWLMFATAATPCSAYCSINSSDYLYFSVTNPQSGTASSSTSQGWVKIDVSAAGTAPTT